MKTAFYPGSFDPMTNGHLDVLVQALNICDRLVVGVGVNAAKQGLFAFDERAAMIRQSVAAHSAELAQRIDVIAFDRLSVDVAREHGATILVKGLRSSTDLDDEMTQAAMNAAMAPDIQTVFVPARPASRPITATLVRQIAKMGGDISAFVPETVAAALIAKFGRS